MKYVIMGGTGFIGSKVVKKLTARGHIAIAAAPETGVNTITGQGLAEAMHGSHAVLDVTNSPTFEPQGILDFFRTSTSNQLGAEKTAHVRHHIVLSIVGTEKLGENAYFKGKSLQEQLVKSSGIPFTIVRSTQFMEYLSTIADLGGKDSQTQISTANVQMIAANDLVDALCDVVTGEPVNRIVQVAGPEREQMSDVVTRYLKARGDLRTVKADPDALYFGSRLDTNTMVPEGKTLIGKTHFSHWIQQFE
ncbi:SDR family oxidoreductase [Agrobacterium tumefaciens]|uniref:SDR family oxidoreductase n=1 Tax=Agrobacterium tumefaciens TaxID=358 RepID=UPI003BA14576